MKNMELWEMNNEKTQLEEHANNQGQWEVSNGISHIHTHTHTGRWKREAHLQGETRSDGGEGEHVPS